ncbi:hypothetical protein [uncultured Flavobacterium sp.]|uniref:hypothetical protein n=1 Tax=uncultured Flavobacterium sp. TaxID=165435 RepID=UPI002930AB55|nr:hypothetical protein [uncultured Flavobacterium sp.]
MSASKNFIQYIDDTYTVKVKEVSLLDGAYVVNGIDTEFFILSLFIENKRVQAVEIFNYDNLMCKSVINDLGIIDLNTITKNHFFTAFSSVRLVLGNQSSDNSSTGGKCCTYGIVRPTFVYTKDLITKNSKFIRFTHAVAYDPFVMLQFGGYSEDTLTPYFKPVSGGLDLDPVMSVGFPFNALFSLDDLFFHFLNATRAFSFDIYLIVNPDSNTFTLLNADLTYLHCYAKYFTQSSDTWLVSSEKAGAVDSIQSFIRWKNIPEPEIE